MTFNLGDWVQVKPGHDIPPMFRPDGAPTKGRIACFDGNSAMVNVPIGDTVDPLTEHSQCVPYGLHMLEPSAAPSDDQHGAGQGGER